MSYAFLYSGGCSCVDKGELASVECLSPVNCFFLFFSLVSGVVCDEGFELFHSLVPVPA